MDSKGALIFDANEHNFERRVLEASKRQPVMVDFWAEWCPPCRTLTPVLEKVVRQYQGRFLFAKVEADENMKLAGRYGLRGFPTVLMFVNGKEAGRFSGAKTEQWVKEFVETHCRN